MKVATTFSRSATFSGHTGSVYSLANASGSAFYSGGGDRVVALWDLNRPDEGEVIARIPAIIYSMILINDELLVGQSDGGIHVIDALNRVEKRLLKYHDSGVFGLFHEPVHGMVFSLSGDGVLAVLDASDLSMQKKLSLGTGKLRSVAVDPGAGLLAVGAGDGSVYVFTLPDLKPVKHWQAHQEGFSVNAVEFSHDGSLLLTGSRDAHLKVFDVNDDFKEKQSIPAHNYAIYSIEFNPDGNLFATASRDKTIKIWDSKTMNVLQRLDREKHSGHVNSVNKIIWHPGGTLISASDDRSVISWRMVNVEL